MADESAKPLAEAASRAAAAGQTRARGGARGRASDVFGGELRRRDVFGLLVLHLVAREPTYGNRLIEEIESLTRGVISVNPNTMYPLLRRMESDGYVAGTWEHPEKRTRRFYEITERGRAELARLRAELEPFLDSMIDSVTLIKDEIYGG